MKSVPFSARTALPKRFAQSIAIGAFSVLGILAGLTPSVQPRSLALNWSTAAYAQNLSQEDINNYARSVLGIEPIRQDAYREIKAIVGSGEVPPIACHQPNSLSGLNRNIREIAVQYCNSAIAIVERNNLSISRFNDITVDLRNNNSLASRIQQAMVRIQQEGSSR